MQTVVWDFCTFKLHSFEQLLVFTYTYCTQQSDDSITHAKGNFLYMYVEYAEQEIKV